MGEQHRLCICMDYITRGTWFIFCYHFTNQLFVKQTKSNVFTDHGFKFNLASLNIETCFFVCLKQFDHDCPLVIIINLMQLFLILMMIDLAARLMSRCDRKCQIKCGPGNFSPLLGFQLLPFMFLFCSEILAQFGISLKENAFVRSSLHFFF